MNTHNSGAYPRFNPATLATLIMIGSVGTVAFDLWGQAISPLIGWGNLSPDGLARSLLQTLGMETTTRAHGQLVHLFFVGLLAYPIGYLFVFRPLWERVTGMTGWFIPSAIYGFALWIFAIGLIAKIAGQPWFLGFARIAWVALIGHVIYGIAAGWAASWIEKRR